MAKIIPMYLNPDQADNDTSGMEMKPSRLFREDCLAPFRYS